MKQPVTSAPNALTSSRIICSSSHVIAPGGSGDAGGGGEGTAEGGGDGVAEGGGEGNAEGGGDGVAEGGGDGGEGEGSGALGGRLLQSTK